MPLLALVLACATPATEALPPSALPSVEARRVRSGPVEGYLVRPRDRAQRWPGVLIQADALSPEVQAAARAEAEPGAVVLAIDPSTDARAAWDYLVALPAVGEERRVKCLRADARCVSPGP